MEHEPGDLGAASVPQRMLAADPLRDLHQGLPASIDAPIVAAAVAARHDDRPNDRQSDLAPVVVAGKDKVNRPPPSQLWELIRGMAQDDGRVGIGTRLGVEGRSPGG